MVIEKIYYVHSLFTLGIKPIIVENKNELINKNQFRTLHERKYFGVGTLSGIQAFFDHRHMLCLGVIIKRRLSIFLNTLIFPCNSENIDRIRNDGLGQ